MFNRVITNAFRNIRRAPYQALAAVLVLTLTFFVTDVFSLMVMGSRVVLQYFETRPQVTAFFTDQVSENAIMEIKQQLELQPYVDKVNYVSKDQALAIYRDENKEDPLLLEMVTADILPPSLEVSATSVDYLPTIREYLQSVKGVDEVVYHQDIVDALIKWTNGLRTGGIAAVAILMTMSLLIISIIISMKIAAKRHEIATMRLLGATNWFINGPFLFEGALYGVVGAFIAWGITYILLLYATPFLVTFLGEIQLLPVSPLFMISLWGTMTGVAVLLGMISGLVSSQRYGRS